MAVVPFVFTNPQITINGNDLSAYGEQATLSYDADAVEKTAFGDDTHKVIGGLKNWSMDITFHQDFQAGNIDAIMFPLVGTVVTCALRPVNSGKTTSNPEYTGSGLIKSYKPIMNSVGQLAGCTVNIVASGTLSRATA